MMANSTRSSTSRIVGIVATEGVRDLQQMEHALLAYRAAHARLIASGNSVVLVNPDTGTTFRIDGPSELRLLLFAAAAAFAGARSAGLGDVAQSRLEAIIRSRTIDARR